MHLVPKIPNPEQPHLTVTVSATAGTIAALASTTLEPHTEIIVVQVETAAVRWTVNGTTPTATVGYRAEAGDVLTLSRGEADVAKFVRESVDAKLQVGGYSA